MGVAHLMVDYVTQLKISFFFDVQDIDVNKAQAISVIVIL
jgi:hypothetical protein